MAGKKNVLRVIPSFTKKEWRVNITERLDRHGGWIASMQKMTLVNFILSLVAIAAAVVGFFI